MVISNKTLSLVLVFAIVVSVAATFIGLYSFVDKFSVQTIVTGYATSDMGYVNLSIAESLNIDVDDINHTLIYGNCTPNASGVFANLGNTAIEGVPNGNCSGDNGTRQYIVVYNIGNVDANVTIQAECNASTFIGSSTALLNVSSSGCVGGDIAGVQILANNTEYYVCSNVSASTQLNYNDLFNVTSSAWIPNNAVGGTGLCLDALNTVTFTARKNY